MSEAAVFEILQLHLKVDDAGTRRYFNSEGQLHRVHGPAVEFLSGDRWWYQNGKLHRTDGPAVVGSYGHIEWYINGEELTEAEFNQRAKLL